MKNTFGFTILYWYNFQCYWQILQTSTDPDQQFYAPFKAGNSRQVQTCYKPTVQRQRKLQRFLVYSGTGETGVFMTLNHWASMQWCSLLVRTQTFHFWQCISFWVSSQLSETILLSHIYSNLWYSKSLKNVYVCLFQPTAHCVASPSLRRSWMLTFGSAKTPTRHRGKCTFWFPE